ncbi:hypothetical protein [Hymenobacter nivis]|uniref:Uncharacterized protein n=1 Tax=Hymenobacter nivis TaxID=1850093 RepID=A0A502GYE2_9BACT|nr:hypothetical protein [Hymenobacter nivis]TPG66056.1 hypothetical protein EAH73_11850 [Hymenobacter nivis]
MTAFANFFGGQIQLLRPAFLAKSQTAAYDPTKHNAQDTNDLLQASQSHADALAALAMGTTYAALSDFGSKPADGDHTAKFKQAVTWCIANGKTLVCPFPIRLSSTTDMLPPSGKSEFTLNILGTGAIGVAPVTWIGPSGTPDNCQRIFNVAGMRSSTVSNMGFEVPKGTHDVLGWDLDTLAGKPAAGSTPAEPNISTTGTNTFNFCGFNIHNGVNNKGFRLGHLSQAGADLSNIGWESCYFYGNGEFAADGSSPAAAAAIEGQFAIQIEGPNCLTNYAKNCTFGYLKNGITTKPGSFNSTSAYAPSVLTGNGDFTLYGGVFSHCYRDVHYNNGQPFRFLGTRHENGRQLLWMPDGGDAPLITFRDCMVDDYTGETSGPELGAVIRIGRPASLMLDQVHIGPGSGKPSNLIMLNNFNGRAKMGSLTVIGGGYPAGNTFYTVEGDAAGAPRFGITVINATQLDGNNEPTTPFANRMTQ